MGESRQELIAWLNDLLQLNLTKVEQCGQGAALAQIFDSIYLDVNLSKVKFAAKNEYEFVQNFKVLQQTFQTHHIDKPIPVDRLVKCRFQDNLEFLQWVKRFWDQYYPGGEPYDAVARRGGQSGAMASIGGVARAPPVRAAPAVRAAPRNTAPRAPHAAPVGRPDAVRSRTPNSASTARELEELRAQVAASDETIRGLEKERDFYFNKLRDIEILVQTFVAEMEEKAVVVPEESDILCKEIQTILYSTEEGFEVPPEEEEVGDDNETF